MPELQSVVALVVTALAVMGSPGPSTVSLTAVAGSFGARKSIPYFWGLVIGTTSVLLAVAVGLTAALLSIPNVAVVLIAASIAYIVYLAYCIATAPPLAEIDPAIAAPSVWGGVVLGSANPKAYVAIAAVFAASRLNSDATLDAIEKTIVLTILIVLIHIFWLVAGAVFAGLLRDPVRSRIANIGLAITVVVFSLVALLPH